MFNILLYRFNISSILKVLPHFIQFIVLFVCVFIVQYKNLNAQKSQVEFEHFSVEQGMSSPNVSDIFQDRKGFIWFATWGGLDKYDGYNFVSYVNDPKDPGSIDNANLIKIYEDRSGIFWIGTWGGLERFDPVTERFTHFTPDASGPDKEWSYMVFSLLEDRSGILWVGTGNGLYIFDRKTSKFTVIKHDSTNPNSLIFNSVMVIYEDKKGDLWFGTGNGLDKYSRQTNKFTHYFTNPNNKNNFGNWGSSLSWITSIYEDEEGIFWVGTWGGGLIKFNPELNVYTIFSHDKNNPQSLGGNKIFALCQDASGILWISTGDDGVDSFDKKTNTFTHYRNDDNNPSSLSDNNTFSIFSERSGTIWVSTNNGVNKINGTRQTFENLLKENIQGLFVGKNDLIYVATKKGTKTYNPNTQKFSHLSSDPDYIFTVDNEGNLWTAKPGGGFNKIDSLGRVTRFYYPSGKEFDQYVSYIYKTPDGVVWFGTGYGLYYIDPITQLVIQKNNFKFTLGINIIFQDSKGLLWIGTVNGGAFCYNRNRDSITHYISDSKSSSGVTFKTVIDIIEDKQGRLWFGSNGGLHEYDRTSKNFIHYPGDGAFAVLEDDHGKLWLNNEEGISKFDPVTKKFKTYKIPFGLPSTVSGFRTKDGTMYFGRMKGLIRFHPDRITDNNFIPPVVITSVKKFDKPFKFNHNINLPYNENFLSFEFAALSFINSESNQYAYKLEGLDKDWVYSGTRRYASYPNLDPGKYIFRVKGSNNDGIWNEAGTSIAIIISPPWWKTWWAYSVYASVLIFALYGIRRYELNRAGLKNKIKMDEAVLKEREETDKIKSRFFANISHEFRTPLTLILGPARKIISGASGDVKKDAKIIERNSQHLLQLINQLLDLSKLEAGKLKLEASKGNIVSFVKGAALSFESLSESKDITLKLMSEREYIELYFDKEKIMKILTNILSNAFKFTPEGGEITVSVKECHAVTILSGSVSYTKQEFPKQSPFGGLDNKEKSFVEIKIRDTGIGILQEEIPKLFDRFYQVDSSHTREYEGTGIGLALTKELIELHHGSISVKSEKGKWTEFTINLPAGRDHLKDDEIINDEKVIETGKIDIPNPEEKKPGPRLTFKEELITDVKSEAEEEFERDEKIIILIVEDNFEMSEYIKESLGGEYQVEQAVNGEQGVTKAEKIIPDLIISDIMMPKMDGNELVRILKNNEKTSHIPIILLTAKAGQENKLEGLETGADDYLTKPFDIKELQVRVKNLIRIRKKLQEKFSGPGFQVPSKGEKKLSSIDEKFMLRVNDIIEKHISEEDFSTEEFGKEIGMSRMQLHRKLKALTGKSAVRYIRNFKLSKAKKLLEEKEGNISEIAYSLGFGSPAYFTKCFKDEFGFPPSEVNH